MRIGLKSTGLALVAAAVLASAVLACRDPAGPTSPDEIAVHRARWSARHLTKYQYDYKLTGFFINFAGRPIRVTVIDGAVTGAQDLTTNQQMPEPPSTWPTIDQLFDQAEHASEAGTLRSIRFDPTFDFPAQMDLAGPPDASGSVFASGLLLPP
jgi:hypothetical protein